DRLDRRHLGGRPRQPDVARREAEVGDTQRGDRLRGRGLALGLLREALLGQVLGGGDDRGQWTLERFDPVVGLALRGEAAAARSAVAAPSARTSNELVSPGTPSRTSRRVAASKRSADRTGTYFTQTTIRMAAVFHHILPGLRMPRGSKTSFTGATVPRAGRARRSRGRTPCSGGLSAGARSEQAPRSEAVLDHDPQHVGRTVERPALLRVVRR